jgi:hypothetical protein
MNDEIQCALSGITPTEDEISYAALPSDDDDVDTLPPGWSVVIIKRRLINPRWLRIQQRMQEQIQAVIEEAGADASGEDKETIQIDIEAMYSNLLINTPATVTQEEEVYLAPPERHPELPGALTQLAETLDIEPAVLGIME